MSELIPPPRKLIQHNDVSVDMVARFHLVLAARLSCPRQLWTLTSIRVLPAPVGLVASIHVNEQRINFGNFGRLPCMQLKGCVVSHTPLASDASSFRAASGDAINTLPTQRWNAPLGSPAALMHGGFIRGAEYFDHGAFNISPTEAACMGPQQRLLLEIGYCALHQVKYRRASLVSNVGVCIGIMSADFATTGSRRPSVYEATGSQISIASGRLSFTFGMQGPCVSVDTACSSALFAVHIASNSLRNGDTSSTLAAACNLVLQPSLSYAFMHARMLSADGRCKTFDARANGYVRGESVGATALNLSGMRADICIHPAVRSDGRSANLTAPNGSSQMVLLQSALHAAGAQNVSLIEAHGTGTALGDPTEARALTRALDNDCLCASSSKANIGHAEPAAGLVGLHALLVASARHVAAPNAQLRILNPVQRNFDCSAMLPLQLPKLARFRMEVRFKEVGVSSFGYGGAIAHCVVHYELGNAVDAWLCVQFKYARTPIHWQAPRHPLIRNVASPDGVSATFLLLSSSALVHDHVVQNCIMFPATGYLELARAAVCAGSTSNPVLRTVHFMNPLIVDILELAVECHVGNGRFDILSNAKGTMYCTGNFAATTDGRWHAFVQKPHALYMQSAYEILHEIALHYGPSFRWLQSACRSGVENEASGTLCRRFSSDGMHLQPADLDAGLQLGILLRRDGKQPNELSLPFAIDRSLLCSATGLMRVVVERSSSEEFDIHLATEHDAFAALLNGVTFRVIGARGAATRKPKHRYMITWALSTHQAFKRSKQVFFISSGMHLSKQHRPTDTCNKVHWALAIMVSSVALKTAEESICALVAIESFTLLLASMYGVGSSGFFSVCLLTRGLKPPSSGASRVVQSGLWGLARAVRAEAQLNVSSTELIGVESAEVLMQSCAPMDELEVAVSRDKVLSARLVRAYDVFTDAARMHVYERGSFNHLMVELQADMGAVDSSRVLMRVRAVGLNFRDVLNVLGEYSSESRQPGDDSAGSVASTEPGNAQTIGGDVFGLAFEPFARFAWTLPPLLTTKPQTLSFDQASSLPVAWSTAHTVLKRAAARNHHQLVIQAAAGGVGLKTVEYAYWAGVSVLGTAGSAHKHAQLRSITVDKLASSRISAAFSCGSARLLDCMRSHSVLNSLSFDFTSISIGFLGETSAFNEIGMRNVWTSARYHMTSSHSIYSVVANDKDWEREPVWMHRVLLLLSSYSSHGIVTSLPLCSFDMETQMELAFRMLQGGFNTGKITVRVALRPSFLEGHFVTGGLSGLGLLIGRWLVQRGATCLFLNSRSGTVAKNSDDWKQLHMEDAKTGMVTPGDVSQASHVNQLASNVAARSSARLLHVWHLAGVLHDAVFQFHTARSLATVYAPKAHGAWALQKTTGKGLMRSFNVFSSVAALLGSPGQANYSAANVCLDALAALRKACGHASASIQWGAWADVGMAARAVKRSKVALAHVSKGFMLIDLAQGLAELETAMHHASPVVLGIVPIVWSQLRNARSSPTFLELLAPNATVSANQGGVDSPEQSSVSCKKVLHLLSRTTGSAKIDADVLLMETGFDSLGMIELRNELQVAVGKATSLPNSLIFDHPTARQLTDSLQQLTAGIHVTRESTQPIVAVVAVQSQPADKRARVIRAVNSVKAQLHAPDMTVVVFEEKRGSVNEELLNEIMAILPCATIAHNERTRGANGIASAGALNTGILVAATCDAATSDECWISILDTAMSIWEPTHLKQCLSVVSGSADHCQLVISTGLDSLPEVSDVSFFSCGVDRSCLFLRRSLLMEAGMFDEALQSRSDDDLYVRMCDIIAGERTAKAHVGLISQCAVASEVLDQTSPYSDEFDDDLNLFVYKHAPRMTSAQLEFVMAKADVGSTLSARQTPQQSNSECRPVMLPMWDPYHNVAIRRETYTTLHDGADESAQPILKVKMLVGIITSDPDRVSRLLDDLGNMLNDREHCVVIFSNSTDSSVSAGILHLLQSQSSRFRSHLIRSTSRVVTDILRDRSTNSMSATFPLPIAVSRTILQTFLCATTDAEQFEAVVVLDDDMRLPMRWGLREGDEKAGDILNGRAIKTPPNPTAMSIRTQLLDFMFALDWLHSDLDRSGSKQHIKVRFRAIPNSLSPNLPFIAYCVHTALTDF